VRRLVAVFAFLLALLAVVSPARARTTQELAYPQDRVWNAALRLVRVDLGCPLGERDAETGFFLFEYVDGARHFPGSVEIVPARVESHDGVRVIVQVQAMPSYIERMILDRLQRKLIEDYGQPPRIVRPPPRGDGQPPGGDAPPGDTPPPGDAPPRNGEGSPPATRRPAANP
jgi:hypothetical protein